MTLTPGGLESVLDGPRSFHVTLKVEEVDGTVLLEARVPAAISSEGGHTVHVDYDLDVTYWHRRRKAATVRVRMYRDGRHFSDLMDGQTVTLRKGHSLRMQGDRRTVSYA